MLPDISKFKQRVKVRLLKGADVPEAPSKRRASTSGPTLTSANARVTPSCRQKIAALIAYDLIRTGGTSNGVSSMCDYSLELIRSRPAKAGDKLVSTSFPNTPTRSFAAADDHSVAVCLLPGTELSFEEEIRCDGMIFSWSPGPKFQQVNKGKRHVYHDALEFPDGKIVLLTQLREGQYATVLQLPALSSVAMHDTEWKGALVE